MSLDIRGPAAPPSPASLMRTGPCVFDPGASPAAPKPHAYSTIPQPLQFLPPLPWAQYGSKAKALLGGCSISKQVWLELWGKGKWGTLCLIDLQGALKLHIENFFFHFIRCSSKIASIDCLNPWKVSNPNYLVTLTLVLASNTTQNF